MKSENLANDIKPVLVEWEHVAREYGFNGTQAIFDHPKHGRLFITDGYGGENTMSGGSVRWRHGMAIKLLAGDTLDSLRETPWNDYGDLYDAVINGYDDTRPVMDWHGPVIEALANQVSL